MTKQKRRRFSQDFSKGGRTDASFAPACDVNSIVKHYQETGIDPYQDRIKLKRYAHASSQSYEEAMRATAEIDSAFAQLPAPVRAQHANNPSAWLESLTTPELPPEPEVAPDLPPAEPAPQGALGGDSEGKVQ